MTQFVYAFNEGNIAMKDLLGGKGANLSEMKRLDYQYQMVLQLRLKLVLHI